jgi:FHA domain-containing protein
MDVLDVAILALRILIVALLYLFLVFVLRTAAGGLRQPATHTSRSGSQALRLVVLEPGGSDLSPGQVMQLDTAATLGRSEQADLVLADPAVSAEHARLERVGRAWVLSDLGSTNGTRLNDAPVHGRTPLADGDVLALGTVRLQVLAG